MSKLGVFTVCCALAWAGLDATRAHAAEGLATPPGDTVWPQWQTRITIHSPVMLPLALAGRAEPPHRATLPTGSVLGDYFFSANSLSLAPALLGLRATGGLVFGSRGLWGGPVAADPSIDVASSASYIGLGYSSLTARSGWGVTADVGLLAEVGTARGAALLGVQGLDRSLRELRLSPLLQLGLRYNF